MTSPRQPEYDARGRALRDLLEPELAAPRPRGLVIAVAGESGSGKTVTARALAAALGEAGHAVSVLHQDDYFVRPPRTNHEHRRVDLTSVGPQEVRLDLLAEHVAAFRAGARDVAGPRVDYPGDRFDTQRHDFGHRDVLIVEGTYVLMLDDADVRVFHAATHAESAERRRARARDIDEPFVAQVLEIEHALIARQRARADVVVDRDFAAHRVARAGG